MEANKQQILKEGKIHGTDTFPCAFYQVTGESGRLIVKHHWHQEFEVLYFKKGAFILDVNMEQHMVAEECFCFINSGELHAIYSKIAYEEHAIVFAPQMISFDSYDKVQNQVIQPMLKSDIQFPRFIYKDQKAFAEVKEIFYEMTSVFREFGTEGEGPAEKIVDDVVSQLYIKGSILRLLGTLLRHSLIEQAEKDNNHRVEAVKKTLLYIRENYKDKIYIRDLAAITNMNEQYFCRFFKKVIGKTPVGYINEYRIKHAKTLLEETDMQVMEVALECGYPNLGNFLKEFKKQTGDTPLQYRNSKKSK